MKAIFPTLLQASTPTQLFDLVNQSLKENDLYAPLFVDNGTLCQWMVPGVSLYEYKLIDAADLIELESKVQSLSALGYEFMFNTVHWNGRLVQWMQRMNSRGLDVKDVLVESLQMRSEAVETGLRMVAAVQKLPRLVPEIHSLNAPFPLIYIQNSTEKESR